jgi:hypothetical protein
MITALACGAVGVGCGAFCVAALLPGVEVGCEEERGWREHESDATIRPRAAQRTTRLKFLSFMPIAPEGPLRVHPSFLASDAHLNNKTVSAATPRFYRLMSVTAGHGLHSKSLMGITAHLPGD